MKKNNPLSAWILYFIVLVNGALIMIFELIGARMMSPYFGGSIIVWTSLIGVIMLSLSIGYWLGGIIADRKADRYLLSLILLLGGVSTLFGAYVYHRLFIFIQASSHQLILVSLLAAISVFLLPNIFLGMVLPYVTKMAARKISTIGRRVGSIYAYATIGSIAGTFLAGFILIPRFSLGDTLIMIVVCLIILSTLAYYADRLLIIFKIILLIFLISNSRSFDPVFAQTIYQTSSAYNFIYVRDLYQNDQHIRSLVANNNTESNICLNCADKLNNVYNEYRPLFSYNPGINEVLIIGGGGYTMASDILEKYSANVTVVEIDPVMTEISRRYFGLQDNPRLNIYHTDGRRYLLQSAKKYDLIILDAFLDSASIPFHLTTIEFIQLLKDHLTNQGLVLVNTVSTQTGPESYFFQHEFFTYQQVFSHLLVYNRAHPELLSNILLIAGNDDVNPGILREFYPAEYIREPEITVNRALTDDWAPVEYFNYDF